MIVPRLTPNGVPPGSVLSKHGNFSNGEHTIRWLVLRYDLSGRWVWLKRLDNNSRSEPAGAVFRRSAHAAYWMVRSGYTIEEPS